MGYDSIKNKNKISQNYQNLFISFMQISHMALMMRKGPIH